MVKDPTEHFKKYIQQRIQACNTLIHKRINKHVIQTNQHNALIKIHKDNQPIRPEVRDTYAPPYKTVKRRNKIFNNLIQLPYTYVVGSKSFRPD